MRKTTPSLLYLAIAVCSAAVLLADLFTPLGLTVWVFYLLPVGMTLLAWRPQLPLMVALATTAFMICTLFTNHAGVDPVVAQINRGFGMITIWAMATVSYFFIKNKIAIDLERWLQLGQTRLSKAMSGDQRLTQLGESILRHLADFGGFTVGAFYAREGDGGFNRIATYGVPENSSIPTHFGLKDGLLGQAVRDERSFLLKDVPDGYLTFGSALGEAKPRHLMICPAISDDVVMAVLEIGFLDEPDHTSELLIKRVSESIALAIRSANYRAHLQALLEETQRQSEELQTQSEELRVANEELEEQGNALKETATRLELQQAELEQSNTQLEEQTQVLETQKDDLERTRRSLEQQTRELERASQYKSEFLANMSHELRTPLNSSLILARLLADNPQGNLSEEQVKFANTILSSGNDLLNLISDILDLSKIEAGQMQVRTEELRLQPLLDDVCRGLQPLAKEKGLDFDLIVEEACPQEIETDGQRLEQILKNLISNAVKFTESGGVKLTVAPAGEGMLGFSVTDTGMGISEEQQAIIFEAFRQADSTSHRKHGGTGLGLSISRELAQLLGGDIELESQLGQGSTFTLTIPLVYQPVEQPKRESKRPVETPPSLPVVRKPEAVQERKPESERPRRANDDRERIAAGDRVLLVVEDDQKFSRILYDLAHESDFQCLIAHTAEDAMTIAQQYQPSAVVLDVGLPDHSGLSVLDRLKNDARTRHIPVHVISGNDYMDSALSMGAVGFMLKPVPRDELVSVLQNLETRLSQRMRRVLVVEDDPVQLESLHALLRSDVVETVGAQSASECLEKLKAETYDCMVLDLTLPDASGYSLLETLSKEDDYSFPPVIVYTGRDLSVEQEQQLRQYSKSIIIKGAKSPERLLDEVTLFLHQVVSELPVEQQRMIEQARRRDAALENRHILIVEDDVRNIFALTSILEPSGAKLQIARNGREAVEAIDRYIADPTARIELVLMDVMMPEMDGIAATKAIRERPECKRLPIIMLTAKAMKDDQQTCLEAGANDYLAKPLDVEKLLSLIRVWMPRQGAGL